MTGQPTPQLLSWEAHTHTDYTKRRVSKPCLVALTLHTHTAWTIALPDSLRSLCPPSSQYNSINRPDRFPNSQDLMIQTNSSSCYRGKMVRWFCLVPPWRFMRPFWALSASVKLCFTPLAHLQLNCISVDSGEGPTWKKDCFISKKWKGFIQTSISNSSFGISKQKPHDLLKKNILKSQKKELKMTENESQKPNSVHMY